MMEYGRKGPLLKGVLALAILLLVLDSVCLAVRHCRTSRRIDEYLRPSVHESVPAPAEQTVAAKDYGPYGQIAPTLLKSGDNFQLQGVLGEQAILLHNNKPVEVTVGSKVGSAVVTRIDGLTVVLKKEDGTELKLSM